MDNIVERVKIIILKPKDAWALIKTEATTVNEIFTGYVVILAALPAVAGFLGNWFFGISGPFFGRYHLPFFRILSSAVVSYVLTLVGVFITAKIVELLAPTFQAQKNSLNAFKVVAYSMTPVWVIGIVAIIPELTPLTILGLYSLYLLYIGLPHLMECPAEKALGYTITIILVMIVVYIIIGAIAGTFIGIPKGMMPQL